MNILIPINQYFFLLETKEAQKTPYLCFCVVALRNPGVKLINEAKKQNNFVTKEAYEEFAIVNETCHEKRVEAASRCGDCAMQKCRDRHV